MPHLPLPEYDPQAGKTFEEKLCHAKQYIWQTQGLCIVKLHLGYLSICALKRLFISFDVATQRQECDTYGFTTCGGHRMVLK